MGWKLRWQCILGRIEWEKKWGNISHPMTWEDHIGALVTTHGLLTTFPWFPQRFPHTPIHPSISSQINPRPLSLSTPLFLELGTFRQAQNLLSSPPGDRFKIWAGLLGHGDRSNLLTAPLLSGVRPQWSCTTFTLVVTLHPGIRFPSFKPHLGARAIYLPCIILCSSVSYSVALYHTL